MATCLSIVGLILLVITNLAIVIAFATPFWLEMSLTSHFNTKFTNRGLWANCDNTNCRWFFEDSFKALGNDPMWFKAVQGLFGVGLGLGLITLLIATISLCCDSKTCSLNHVIAGLLLLTFLTLGVAVILFGVKAHEDDKAEIIDAPTTYSWSFWLGIAASGLSLMTAVLYACEGRKYYYD